MDKDRITLPNLARISSSSPQSTSTSTQAIPAQPQYPHIHTSALSQPQHPLPPLHQPATSQHHSLHYSPAPSLPHPQSYPSVRSPSQPQHILPTPFQTTSLFQTPPQFPSPPVTHTIPIAPAQSAQSASHSAHNINLPETFTINPPQQFVHTPHLQPHSLPSGTTSTLTTRSFQTRPHSAPPPDTAITKPKKLHREVEQKRRMRMAEQIQELRRLVSNPNTGRSDKVSVLQDAVIFVKNASQKIQFLQHALDQSRSECNHLKQLLQSPRIDSPTLRPPSVGPSTINPLSSSATMTISLSNPYIHQPTQHPAASATHSRLTHFHEDPTGYPASSTHETSTPGATSHFPSQTQPVPTTIFLQPQGPFSQALEQPDPHSRILSRLHPIPTTALQSHIQTQQPSSHTAPSTTMELEHQQHLPQQEHSRRIRDVAQSPDAPQEPQAPVARQSQSRGLHHNDSISSKHGEHSQDKR